MTHPNVIYILADDMGYGDVRHLNPDCAFPTPHLDRICQEGMHYTDAHSSSAVCTPSRYSIMTGRYCWRTYLKQGVLVGTSRALIEPGRETVASLAKQAGYNTACIGKWHLGWEWVLKEGHREPASRNSWEVDELDWIDYDKPIQDGPTTCGFDTFYGIAGSLDMPPYVYVDQDRAVETPTAWASQSEFYREGPRMASMRANNVLGHLTDKAVDYVNAQAQSDAPFFLYFPLTAPHTPIAPAPEFDGISGVSPYADFCMEVDARVGQVLDALDATGQAKNTLIIFTTDNGASAGPSECAMLEKRYGHYCSHHYRGYKSDIWDGGHRLPFLTRWPETIAAGSRCDQTVGIFDLFATLAEITGTAYGDDAGEDAVSLLPAMRGGSIDEDARTATIHHSIGGQFAVRRGRYKLCGCAGSGGWTEPTDVTAAKAELPPLQLYDMEADAGERKNLAEDLPDVATELTAVLREAVTSGRTTPGTTQDTDTLEGWTQLDWLPGIPEAFVMDD